jgi:hypothetical protein
MKTQAQRIITAYFTNSIIKRTPMALSGKLHMLTPVHVRYFAKKTKQ